MRRGQKNVANILKGAVELIDTRNPVEFREVHAEPARRCPLMRSAQGRS